MSSVIGRIYIQRECHSVLAKLHPITFYWIVFLGSARFLGWMPLFVFFGLPIVSCSLIKANTRMLVTFGICFKQHFDTRYLVFYNPSPPRMFLSLDLLSEYRIQHGSNGPLYVTSSRFWLSECQKWLVLNSSSFTSIMLKVRSGDYKHDMAWEWLELDVFTCTAIQQLGFDCMPEDKNWHQMRGPTSDCCSLTSFIV